MNNLELDSIAQGLFLYLKEQSDNPLDAIAIVGVVLLKIFDDATQKITIEKFADDFKLSLIASYKARSQPGTVTKQ